MRIVEWSTPSPRARAEALARPARRSDAQVAARVRRIFDDVERDGETAVASWAEEIDGRPPERLQLSSKVVNAARAKLKSDELEALDLAVANVRRYHEATKPKPQEVEVRAGVRCRREWRPIASCGLYVPGGTAPLFSTLIMLATPAAVAGVPQRIAVTPPGKQGPHPMMIAAAAACGLDALWLIGGAQAIAALTFGAGLPKAEKIFGPGNAYVAEAKRYAASLPGGPQIDVPAGPSELMVIADAGAEPALLAADLLSQAEHDVDAQVLLASDSAALIEAVRSELARQTPLLPRAEIAQASLQQARAILVREIAEAAEVANAYAPEHLSLQVNEPEALLPQLVNAGAVFVGASSGETFGDYICGPSHVLPTDGAARAWGGVNMESFMKSFSVQTLDAAGARALAGPAALLARLEGLEAHARAAEMRAR